MQRQQWNNRISSIKTYSQNTSGSLCPITGLFADTLGLNYVPEHAESDKRARGRLRCKDVLQWL